jgi:hypothetical protein
VFDQDAWEIQAQGRAYLFGAGLPEYRINNLEIPFY